jgi:hypothetical protein
MISPPSLTYLLTYPVNLEYHRTVLWRPAFSTLHPPGQSDKNLCRCFGAPARRVFPDHLITYLPVTFFSSLLLPC